MLFSVASMPGISLERRNAFYFNSPTAALHSAFKMIGNSLSNLRVSDECRCPPSR